MINENSKSYIWTASTVAIALLALFLLVISIKEIKSLGRNDTPVFNSISVNGKGEAIVIPDIATVSFGVSESGKTVEEAQTKATTKMNSALDAVKSMGVAERDIKTASYNINPKYEYTQGVCNELRCLPGKQTLTGYEVSQYVTVKIRELKDAGKIVESIGSLGVQNVSGISFGVDDIDEVREVARAEAIANAKVKAEELARSLGVDIVRIIGFYDSSDNPYPMYSEMGMGGDMMVKSAMPERAPELPQGEEKVVVNVTITYEIK